jgi:hypothetical protein
MINLTLNQLNTFALDLFPLRKTQGSDYWFEFKHDQQKKLFEIVLTDVSVAPISYQLFELDLAVDLQNMTFTGDYEYKVFDSVQKDNLVGIGKMKLVGQPRANKTNQIITGDNKIHNE